MLQLGLEPRYGLYYFDNVLNGVQRNAPTRASGDRAGRGSLKDAKGPFCNLEQSGRVHAKHISFGSLTSTPAFLCLVCVFARMKKENILKYAA